MDIPFRMGDCSVEIDRIGKGDWERSIRDFEDMSVYQTWSWGKLLSGEDHMSHMVLRRDGNPVSMTQVRISTVPVLCRGMASVAWGPLWLKRGAVPDPEILRYTLRLLREEYAEKRKLFLILKPSITSILTTDAHSLFLGEGFRPSPLREPYHTLVMDISPPLESLLAGMKPEWRRNLMKSRKNGLEIESGSGEGLLREMSELYRQMLARKRFRSIADLRFYKCLQRDLDNQDRLSILICRHNSIPVAGLIYSALGKTPLVLNGATGDRGLNLHGSYSLWWRAIEHLNERGHRWLDTCGISQTRNPGGYQFKSGVCGKWGRDVLSREYQYCASFTSKVLVHCGQSVKEIGTGVKERFQIKRAVRG